MNPWPKVIFPGKWDSRRKKLGAKCMEGIYVSAPFAIRFMCSDCWLFGSKTSASILNEK